MNIENKINGFTFAEKYRDKYRSDMDSEEKEEFRKLLSDSEVIKEVVKIVAEQVLLSVSINDYFSSAWNFPSDVSQSMFSKAIEYISTNYRNISEYDKVKIRKSIYAECSDDILKDLKWDLVTFTDYDWNDLQGKYVGRSILDKTTLRETAYRKLNEWLFETKKEEVTKGIAELINKDNEKQVKELQEKLKIANERISEISNIIN